jgi:signal transduction histidine kinase
MYNFHTMQTLFDNFSLLLTTPPGNLAYHLVLIFSIVGTLQGVFGAISPHPKQRQRMILGLVLLLFLHFSLFIAAGFAWQGALPSVIALPILDRAAALLSCVLCIWIWAFSQPRRGGDVAMILVALLVASGVMLAGQWWMTQPAESAFNGSLADAGLNGLAIGVLSLGAVILLARRPQSWGLGMAMLVLLALGHALALIWGTVVGEFSGYIRITQLAAFPWFLALPASLVADVPAVTSAAASRQIIPERKRYNLQPILVQELLTVLDDPNHPDFGRNLVKIIAQIMLADFCMLLVPSQQENQILVAQAYNLIEEKYLDGFSIDSRLLPGIDSALRRGRILRLPSGSTSADLTVLAQRLHLSRVGHLMLVPVALPGEEPRMGILLLSPYSNRSWAADDQTFLGQIATSIVGLSATNAVAVRPGTEGGETTARYDQMEQYINQLQAENHRLLSDLDQLKHQAFDDRTRAETLAALVESQRQGVETSATPSIPDGHPIEKDLRLALRQVADLKKALAEADQKLIEAQSPRIATAPISQQDRDEIIGLVEELRQPLASVIGNADILLDETMGILGTYQKKFVERIRTAGERMTVLYDDLVQAATMAGLGDIFVPQPIDLNAIIDNAIDVAMGPLRDKNLTLRVDISADLPVFRADPQSVQRILTNLLQNAGTCSPVEGEVSLRARAETLEHEPGYVLIQVSDTGGGIAPNDLPRIFSQSVKSGSPEINGLGNPPEPFSTTKTLIEAHGGRIWVDSLPGQGAMFSVLFPISMEGLSVR